LQVSKVSLHLTGILDSDFKIERVAFGENFDVNTGGGGAKVSRTMEVSQFLSQRNHNASPVKNIKWLMLFE
jgi:hypothetical protein